MITGGGGKRRGWKSLPRIAQALAQQIIYWKPQGTIKWVKFDDEGTKLFHASATIRSRKNLITTLQDNAGNLKSLYSDKVAILCEAFKESTSEFQGMQLNLGELLSSSDHLAFLEEPFTPEEIDPVVQSLPSDKLPGSDCLNTEFIKRAWPIIKFDFYELCMAFYEGSIYLQSINGSTLLSFLM